MLQKVMFALDIKKYAMGSLLTLLNSEQLQEFSSFLVSIPSIPPFTARLATLVGTWF